MLAFALSYSSTLSGFECTTLRRRLNSNLKLESDMFNITLLCCRLVGWHGIGADCAACDVDSFGLGASSLTFSLTVQAGIILCKCKTGTYWKAIHDLMAGLC